MKKMFVYSTLAAFVIAVSGCSQTEKTISDKPKIEEVESEEILNAEGEFVGLADPHTVEIQLEEGAKAFQFKEELKSTIAALTENAKIKFEYIEKSNGQRVITKITVLESALEEKSGTYVGLADPHTIEVQFQDGARAFQITEELKNRLKNVPEGTKITVQYEKNVLENFQLEEKLIEETGVYVGQADPHTVEIETANGAQSYQLSVVVMEDIGEFKKDDSVTFQYVKNDLGQLVIKSIHKK